MVHLLAHLVEGLGFSLKSAVVVHLLAHLHARRKDIMVRVCVCVCVYIQTHTYLLTHIHTHIHTHTYIHTHTHTYVYTYYIHACMHAYTRVINVKKKIKSLQGGGLG